MTSTGTPLMDRRYRDMTDVIAHIREQARTLVSQVNEGREYTAGRYAEKAAEVEVAMIAKVGGDLEARGRRDLAAKLIAAYVAAA
jgi:hypothetical protein